MNTYVNDPTKDPTCNSTPIPNPPPTDTIQFMIINKIMENLIIQNFIHNPKILLSKSHSIPSQENFHTNLQFQNSIFHSQKYSQSLPMTNNNAIPPIYESTNSTKKSPTFALLKPTAPTQPPTSTALFKRFRERKQNFLTRVSFQHAARKPLLMRNKRPR